MTSPRTVRYLGGCGIIRRMRVDEIEPKTAKKKLANEARVLPLRLASRLGDLASFFFARDMPVTFCHDRLRKMISPIIEIAANENH